MKNVISIECPVELLLSLHLNIEDFSQLVKIQSAISLFKEGKISSGMAAQWLNIPSQVEWVSGRHDTPIWARFYPPACPPFV